MSNAPANDSMELRFSKLTTAFQKLPPADPAALQRFMADWLLPTLNHFSSDYDSLVVDVASVEEGVEAANEMAMNAMQTAQVSVLSQVVGAAVAVTLQLEATTRELPNESPVRQHILQLVAIFEQASLVTRDDEALADEMASADQPAAPNEAPVEAAPAESAPASSPSSATLLSFPRRAEAPAENS